MEMLAPCDQYASLLTHAANSANRDVVRPHRDAVGIVIEPNINFITEVRDLPEKHSSESVTYCRKLIGWAHENKRHV